MSLEQSVTHVFGLYLKAIQQLAAADRGSSGEEDNPKANSAGPAAELEAVGRLVANRAE
jgi:hypothetical protein